MLFTIFLIERNLDASFVQAYPEDAPNVVLLDIQPDQRDGISARLDDETELIDLPGLKKLDFVDIHRDEARFYFREFSNFAEDCKFRDCLHLSEHKCAVKNAVENNEISPQRYKSYLNFVESL